MIDTTEKIPNAAVSRECSDQERYEKIGFYQIDELHREIDYLKRRLSVVPEPVQWCCKHLRQLWWTTSALAGLGWLHDGSRQVAQNIASTPTISHPTVPAADAPAPRLFLDVTVTYQSKINTGVQRVIRELCRYGEIDGSLFPVIIDQGVFLTVPDRIALDYREGDKILLLDSSWTHTKAYVPALENAKSKGFVLILGIYDLIPIQHPGFVHPYFTKLFEDWLQTTAPYCSAILAISRYSAESFLTWARKNKIYKKIPPTGWFYLGANLPERLDTDLEADENALIPADFWLSVGTIEPRKGYSIALDAFDHLWRNNFELSYVIIGRQGDLSRNIIERIINHPKFGKKLFWPQNVNDRQLNQYYRKAKGVLIPTLAEGFGLPLIEAHFHRKPIIASDLPVFREIAPNGISFFNIADAGDLASKIRNAHGEPSTPSSTEILSWQTATQKMVGLIKNNDYQISSS